MRKAAQQNETTPRTHGVYPAVEIIGKRGQREIRRDKLAKGFPRTLQAGDGTIELVDLRTP
ncbi:MAG: hypothetical protein ACI8TX_003613 [Hyphomicrobiaceae bacterium]|jgi:hypothetical protein